MDHNVKQMLKLIEEGDFLSKKAEMHRPNLVPHVKEFCHLYCSLADCYDHLIEELQKDIPSGSDQGSPLLTPDQKLGMHKSSHQAASPSCGRGIPITIDGEGFTKFPSLIKRNQEAEDDNADSLLEGRENGSYEELLGGIIEYEEKIRVSNLRLQLSEEEAARKLVTESDFEIERLLKELELTRERLKGSNEEIERLKNELVNEISVGTHLVQGQLKLAQEDVAKLNTELDSERRKELKVALSDAQENFSLEKAQLQSKISSLLEKQALGDERVKEQELLCTSLEEKIWKSEVENMETLDFNDCRERDMQDEITRLMEGVTERGNHVEALNKDLNMLKLKHDCLWQRKMRLLQRESSSQTGQKRRERQSCNFASHRSITGADIKNFAKLSLGSSGIQSSWLPKLLLI
ncbi:hypothetical protein Dsin_024699 [Dipteronia sinensis]|uniref:NAB domain-containing protein n=1 Tax=Dipteronia sinensis TaxID=43782 RepID=A0AAD9ZUS1_9ROSI|nr:hypothetical protein Dsin_024699 [Dipteronia sinensis]